MLGVIYTLKVLDIILGLTQGGPANATLPVAGVVGNIFDINFSIDGTVCGTADGSTTVGIDHTFVADLILTLTSPSATNVVVVVEVDGEPHRATALYDPTLVVELRGPRFSAVEEPPAL